MSRNASGTYTLVAGNPVVTGTVVASAWANDTLTDVATEMTDSLSRTGKGGMTSPLKVPNGTVAAPAYTFSNFLTSGAYMAGTADYRVSVGGIDRLKLTASGAEVVGDIVVSGTVDGRDVAADGATADAALPKAGGTMTGIIAGFESTGIDDQATAHRVTITDTEITTDVPILDPSGNVRGGRKNAIINGNFDINQRAVSGTVTLASGAYGHDRWKGGASGCTYTFATVENITTITISAGSLIQVVEGSNLFSGTYTLSFVGTAQGKIEGGSYSDSGVTGSITGGINTSVEFDSGTISKTQLEAGSVATEFEPRTAGEELELCQRYYINLLNSARYRYRTGNATLNAIRLGAIGLPTTMRTSPTVVSYSTSVSNASSFGVYIINPQNVSFTWDEDGANANVTITNSFTADAEL